MSNSLPLRWDLPKTKGVCGAEGSAVILKLLLTILTKSAGSTPLSFIGLGVLSPPVSLGSSCYPDVELKPFCYLRFADAIKRFFFFFAGWAGVSIGSDCPTRPPGTIPELSSSGDSSCCYCFLDGFLFFPFLRVELMPADEDLPETSLPEFFDLGSRWIILLPRAFFTDS